MSLFIATRLGQFGATRSEAVQGYLRFVMDGVGLDSPLEKVRHQLILGDDAFTTSYHCGLDKNSLRDVSKTQRRAMAWPLDEYRQRFSDRDEAIARAYLSMAFSMTHIAEFFDVSLRTVSRAVKKFELKS